MVQISASIVDSHDFRNYLAVSRDSFPMGLGRIVALCLHALAVGRTHLTSFEIDRAGQWPADRKLTFAETLKTVGWAKDRANSRTLVELTLPQEILPRRPFKERASLRRERFRDTDGKFASREVIEAEIFRWKNLNVILIDMDGLPRHELQSIEGPIKPSNVRRRKRE